MDLRAGIGGEQLARLAQESCRQHRQFHRISGSDSELEFGLSQSGIGASVGPLHQTTAK